MERSRSYSGNVPSNGGVKIGGLWKRSQGLSRLTRPNYRHRVFILTENALSYYSGTVDVSWLLSPCSRAACRLTLYFSGTASMGLFLLFLLVCVWFIVRLPFCLQRVGQPKGRVALDAITAVEFVDESAFNLPHTLQVGPPLSLSSLC